MHDYFENMVAAITNPLPEIADYIEKENNYLKGLVTKNSVVLDVGCGLGRTVKFLAPLVKKVVGIDYDEKSYDYAQKDLAGRTNIKLVKGDFFKTTFNQKFDLVTALYNLLGSTELLLEQRKFLLKQMIQNTKLGGHVIFTVWSDQGINFADKYYPSIGIRVLKIERNDVVTDRGTFKRFSKKELVRLTKVVAQKFKVIDLTPIFYLIDIEV